VSDVSALGRHGGLRRRVRRSCDEAIAAVDDLVGRVLRVLERGVMAAATAFVATSDHGDFLGERNRVFKDHSGTLLYEDLVRVPLFLTLPPVLRDTVAGGASGGRRWAAPVQHVDLLPTLAALAGVPAPPGLAGHSLLDQLGGGVAPEERWALSEAAGGRSAAFRRGRFKYICDPRDPLQQLYDLTLDPGERHNLAGQAG